jgi:23S rRNA (uracil1939-C5)-methyltransferase
VLTETDVRVNRGEQTFEVTIETMATGGAGLARRAGRMIFVPYTIPGERVVARVTRQQGDVLHAEGVTLIDASADRVYPVCPHFGPGRCGRCQWQHIAYEAQLLLKQDILADQLERVGGLKESQIARVLRPPIASPEQWGYNYHMTFTVTDAGTLGLPTLDDRGIFPIRECHILHPDLLALYEVLDLDLSGIRRVKLQIGTDGTPMVILMMAEDAAPELEADLPASVNLLLPDNEPVNLIGDSHSFYHIDQRAFRVTAGSYFRANVGQIARLAREVETLLDLPSEAAVLDLYAGVGVFSAFLAPRARQVTLVESYPPAVTDADDNLSDFDHIDVIEGGVEAVLPALEDRYDAAVIDAPSQGMSSAALDALTALDLAHFVYLSDSPAALAREIKRLGRKGYHVTAVQPIDLAPQTYYVDSIARFEKQG